MRAPRPFRSFRVALAASGALLLGAAALAPLRRPDARWPGGSTEFETLAFATLGAALGALAVARSPQPARAAGIGLLGLAALALASPLLFGLGEALRFRLAMVEALVLALLGAWVAYAATEGAAARDEEESA